MAFVVSQDGQITALENRGGVVRCGEGAQGRGTLIAGTEPTRERGPCGIRGWLGRVPLGGADRRAEGPRGVRTPAQRPGSRKYMIRANATVPANPPRTSWGRER